MTAPRLVVVGASLAGLRTVERARADGFAGEVTLVGAEPHLPYDRPPLSKVVLAPGESPADVPLRTRDELDELDVRMVLGAPATGLDPAARTVELGGAHDGETLAYDALVVATGTAPRRPPWWAAGSEHASLAGVHALRTREDAAAVRSALDAGARTVVVGAGFVGAEVASSARARGVEVTVVEAAPVPLVRALGETVGARCARLHADHGVALRCGAAVTGLRSEGGRVTGVELDGETLAADLVVVGVGVAPATDWLDGSGIARHDDGGLVCDAGLTTSAPGVWAAGDVAHVPLPLLDGEHARTEHWTNAAEHGGIAGANAVATWTGAEARTVDSVPYFWSDWYGRRLQLVGSPRADDVRVLDERDGVDPDRPVALYRRGDRVVGVFSLDRPRDIMKLRRHVTARTPWDDAVAAVLERVAS